MWCLGIEWYRNESGKEFDGKIQCRTEADDGPEALKLMIPAVIQATKDRFQHHPESMSHEMHQAVSSGTWWIHIFHKPTLDRMPKNMFDATEELNPVEKSFEEIMGETKEQLADPMAPLQRDFFYDRNGNEINGLPDFWMIQAGLC